MKIRNCSVCGRKFESHYGKEVCSDECFLIRKKENEKWLNERRYSGKSGEPLSKVCPWCGKEFEGLNRKYCSQECSDNAQKKHRAENFTEYYNDPVNRKHHIELTSNRAATKKNEEGKGKKQWD